MSTGLIAGMGEVGKALHAILSSCHAIQVNDILDPQPLPSKVDVLHICFPYSGHFLGDVRAYQQACCPLYTVIHSTVPIGTTMALRAHHSPVRGSHPHLAESMRKFTTYLAPQSAFLQDYFTAAGMILQMVRDPRDTEAGKLLCLMAYAWSIALEKEIHEFCQDQLLDFDLVYREFTKTYNEGYALLGQANICRPIIADMPGPIGGHCVIPAVKLLEAQGFDTASFILDMNEAWERKAAPPEPPAKPIYGWLSSQDFAAGFITSTLFGAGAINSTITTPPRDRVIGE